MITKVILTRDEVEAMIAREASYTLTGRPRDEMDACVTGSYGYGDVTVTFTPKKVPDVVATPNPGIPVDVSDKLAANKWAARRADKPSLSSIETITDVSPNPAAVSENGV